MILRIKATRVKYPLTRERFHEKVRKGVDFMAETSYIQKILRNPAFGLMSLFIFSLLVLWIDTRLAASIGLVLAIVGYVAVKRYSRLIYDISIVAFAIAVVLSFTLFPSLPVLNRFVIVEIIFVLSLILMRLSRGKIVSRVVRRRDTMLKNYLKESFRVAFQTQYGLSIHLLLVLAFFLFNADQSRFINTAFMVVVCQIILLAIMVFETARLHILDKKLYQEEWLPVVTEKGNVTGRVAKSITKGLKNRFMHPVVRVALLHDGRIYLKERNPSRLLNPGKLDYPFEKYMQFNHAIDEAVRNSLGMECGNKDLPLRFLLKYSFENEITKRLIFLYVSNIEDEETFNCLNLEGGKLWTIGQIEDNMGTELFSECFELEFEYLKNTVLLAHQFRKDSK